MSVTTHRWGDVVASVFQLNDRERIPKHQHPYEHSTCVVRGSSNVCVWYPDGLVEFEMRPGDSYATMPADIEHEITAIENDTIIINMHTLTAPAAPGTAGADGGIAYDD